MCFHLVWPILTNCCGIAVMSLAAGEKDSIELTFPDGACRTYPKGVTGFDVAKSISNSLAKSAVAVEVGGQAVDLYIPIDVDSDVKIITIKDEQGLDIIRHDTAHIMAQAVQELYEDVQVTIGPSIADGFYYDFVRAEPFTLEDLEKIEQRMKDIVARAEEVRRVVMSREEAIDLFAGKGEDYKVEIIKEIPKGEAISLYEQGDFVDLCRGPHAPSTSSPKAFKLMKVAGAYWRGDAKNAQLQRIYGTAWANAKDLDRYLTRLEEAKKRDHRKLGKDMGLFHIQEEAVGQVFWHDKGWTLYRTLESYIRQKLKNAGYMEVKTPLLADRVLWEKSGHWDKFRENMFTSESEDKTLAIKPMNCPCHVQIFNQGIKSYKDLPLRMAEFGMCHRNEPSGSLHGIMRVRGFTQDDAHIFCTEDQITEETKAFCDLLLSVYKELGFDEVKVKFSDRPEVRAGDDAIWDRAELSLKNAVEAAGLPYELNPGEGAFYGPKLEFVLTDAIGRDWQCGTIQVDFVLPERLDANYVGADGQKHRPVMLHRAILGAFERFIGILIEQYAGRFPLWLAPVQVVVATVTNEADSYAEEVVDLLRKNSVRVNIDVTSDKISYKIRNHSTQKVPIIIAVGGKEKEQNTVSIRRLGSKEQEVLALQDAVGRIRSEVLPPVVHS